MKRKFTFYAGTFCDDCKAARKGRGLRQSLVADMVGIPVSTLSKIENGKLVGSTGCFLALCAVLKLDPFYYIDFEETDSASQLSLGDIR